MTDVDAALAAYRANPTDATMAAVLVALRPVILGRVGRGAHRVVCGWMTQEDLIQECMVVAARCVETFLDGADRGLTQYVSIACRNLIHRMARDRRALKRGHNKTLGGADGELLIGQAESTESGPLGALQRAELIELVQRLPECERRAIVAYYWGAGNDVEVGRALGAERRTAKKIRRRALERLRRYYLEGVGGA